MSGRLIGFLMAGSLALAGCQDCRRGAYIAGRTHCCYGCGDAPPAGRIVPVPAPPGIGSRPPPIVATPPRVPAPPPAVPFSPPPAEIGRPTPPPPVECERPITPPPADIGSPPPPAERDPTPPPPEAGTTTPPPESGTTTPPPSTAVPGEATPPDVRLGPPARKKTFSARPPEAGTKEPPLATVPGSPGPAPGGERNEKNDKDAPQPIDLPGYAVAVTNVATGLRPFPDGISWLKTRGYKTVLHLRAPGEDTTASKKLFEKKGLDYTSLEASPARMSKELYDQFVKQVNDTTSQPLFVYDKDGSMSGGLWYLYFRVHLKQTDAKARSEAQRLGLRFDDDTEHQTTWLAVQKLRETLGP